MEQQRSENESIRLLLAVSETLQTTNGHSMNYWSFELVKIYNSNEMYHRGKLESINCAPCIARVIDFFKEHLKGADKTAGTGNAGNNAAA